VAKCCSSTAQGSQCCAGAGACALLPVSLRQYRHTLVMWYLSVFHGNKGYVNASQYSVTQTFPLVKALYSVYLSNNNYIYNMVYQQNAHIQYNTCTVINTVLHVSALIEPSSGWTLSSSLCHAVGPLVDLFRSHVASLFKGLPWFLLPVGQ
jgi:hypothetical protein